MALYNVGDLITFSYPAVHQSGTKAHDRFPQILVLHTNWEGLIHGINFHYLTNDEINSLRMLLDPSFEMKYKEALLKKNKSEVDRMEAVLAHSANSNITSPRDFYERVVRPFLGIRGRVNSPSPPPDKDAYRLYRPDKMSGVRILQRRQHLEGVPQKQGVFQSFIDKFKNMRGPKLPRFRRPGELPGTHRDEDDEK